MSSTPSPGSMSRSTRIVAFVREFLPEQNLQLFLPLASLLLLLGTSQPWFRLEFPSVSEAFRSQFGIDRQLLTQLTQSIAVWVSIEEQFAHLLVHFAFLASLVLWTLPVRRLQSKFALWVALPTGCALIGYPVYLAATASRRLAFLQEFARSVNMPLPPVHSRLPSLGNGFYLTLSGIACFAFALWLVHRGRISLPLRFRGYDQETNVAGRDGRDVFTLLIGTVIWAAASSVLWSIPMLRGKVIMWSGSFAIYEWLPALASAVVSATIAVFLFRERVSVAIRGLLRNEPLRKYVVGVGIPCAVALGPRIFLKLFSDVPLSFRNSGGWVEILPGPFPQILLVCVISLFEEFALRGYLQSTLEKHFSLGRAIFLTALLWALLPLGWGTAQWLSQGPYLRLPGVSFLALAAARIIYSVPLGWLFASTRSIIPVTLMHGTIMLFHLGYGRDIQLNHPQLYFVELALWVFVGWYLMGERRYVVRGVSN